MTLKKTDLFLFKLFSILKLKYFLASFFDLLNTKKLFFFPGKSIILTLQKVKFAIYENRFIIPCEPVSYTNNYYILYFYYLLFYVIIYL